MALRKLVAGNWKMHGTAADLGEVTAISLAAETAGCDVALCLPATLIERAARAAPGFAIGGQDCHAADKGAHTGDISAAMLKDAGATLTIVGHSERREAHGETDADVRAKAEAALARGPRCDPLRRREPRGPRTRAGRRHRRRSSSMTACRRSTPSLPWPSPTSRSGRSAPARFPRPPDIAEMQPRSASGWSPPMARPAARSASSTAAR